MRFASTLLAQGAKSVLVTLGARGVMLVRAGAFQPEHVAFGALRPTAEVKSVTGAGASAWTGRGGCRVLRRPSGVRRG